MNFSHNLKCCIIIVIPHIDEARKQLIVAYHRSPAHIILESAVVYPGGHQVDVPADSIDDAFVARLAAFMQKMTSDMPPRRVPSWQVCRWCEIAFGDCPDRFVDVTLIHFNPVEHHIHDRAQVRLCDGRPVGPDDISSEAIFELRDARRAATLCPDCQDEVHPRDVKSDLYGMGRHSTAHLYSVPVLAGFDAVRNCSHCRRSTDDDCASWRKLRSAGHDNRICRL